MSPVAILLYLTINVPPGGDDFGTTTKAQAGELARVNDSCAERRSANTSPICWRVEQALRDRNYNPGEIDGRWDTAFWEALTQFKRDQGLDSARRVDSRTLRALGF
jgi:hypothetical protein